MFPGMHRLSRYANLNSSGSSCRLKPTLIAMSTYFWQGFGIGVAATAVVGMDKDIKRDAKSAVLRMMFSFR